MTDSSRRLFTMQMLTRYLDKYYINARLVVAKIDNVLNFISWLKS